MTTLILDDDDDLREAITAILVALNQPCLALPSLGSMIDARHAVLGCGLAILDINLGAGQPSGVDAFEWLRENGFGGRVVFLTGHAPSEPLVVRASGLGAPVLQKPISTTELRALLKESQVS